MHCVGFLVSGGGKSTLGDSGGQTSINTPPLAHFRFATRTESRLFRAPAAEYFFTAPRSWAPLRASFEGSLLELLEGHRSPKRDACLGAGRPPTAPLHKQATVLERSTCETLRDPDAAQPLLKLWHDAP